MFRIMRVRVVSYNQATFPIAKTDANPPPKKKIHTDNKAIGVCKPGHVFTIEPMINEGTWRDELWQVHEAASG